MGLHDRETVEEPFATTPDDDEERRSQDEESAEEERDVWATAEGYTPLADMESSGFLTTSMGPGHPEDTAAFRNHYESEDDDEDNDEAESLGDTGDFRAVAEGALSALEEEYRQTLQKGSNSSSSNNNNTETVDVEKLSEESLPPIRLLSEDFGSDYFVANFPDQQQQPTIPPPPKQQEIPDIDTEAVRRAVQAIQLRDPQLKDNLDKWEAYQKAMSAVAPRLHPIIPSEPLAAFRSTTTRTDNNKNKKEEEEEAFQATATATLSRSACIAEALRRLDLLQGQERLRIDIVGCEDHVECSSIDRIQQLFGPIVQWIGAYAECPKHLEMHLIGPNLVVTVNDAPSNSSSATIDFSTEQTRLSSAQAFCHAGIYPDCGSSNDFAASTTTKQQPDLVISFHAGIWGYREWPPALRQLAQERKLIPVVVTAYTLQEAQDDAEVIQQEISSVLTPEEVEEACIWEPEMNPFASKIERETATAVPGRIYRENAAWQAWRL